MTCTRCIDAGGCDTEYCERSDYPVGARRRELKALTFNNTYNARPEDLRAYIQGEPASTMPRHICGPDAFCDADCMWPVRAPGPHYWTPDALRPFPRPFYPVPGIDVDVVQVTPGLVTFYLRSWRACLWVDENVDVPGYLWMRPACFAVDNTDLAYNITMGMMAAGLAVD